MIRECFKCNTGIVFDAVMLQKIGLNLSINDGPRDSLKIELCDPPKRRISVAAEDSANQAEMIMRQDRIPFAHTGKSFHGLWSTVRAIPTCIARMARRLRNWRSNRHVSWMSESAPGQIGKRFDALLKPPHELRRDRDESYEADEEMKDAQSPKYDKLAQPCAWWWQFMEWIPLCVKEQRAIASERSGRSRFRCVPIP